jgi:type IV secretory pathway TraG/TraD family ATPase VirD4
MLNLPVSEAVKHFLACGTVGSGKTTTIQLFLQSIAKRFRMGSERPEQLIVFDAKGDMIPRLEALGLKSDDPNFWIFNPFDTRGAVLDLGDAVQTPAMARYLSSILVPEERNSTAPYFFTTAQQIVYWIAVSLARIRRRTGKNWTLRDLLNALESRDRIAAITRHHERASHIIEQHFADERNFPGVLSHLQTRLGKFEEVAALWHTCKSGRIFSITEFLKSSAVLVLGHDPVLSESIWPMNAVLLQALTNEILREDEVTYPRHWFVLDEFRAMEDVRCVRTLLNMGRSKGASVLLGIQSVEGLYELYQEHAANEILGLCSTKTFFRSGGPVTAEWAERHFNKVRHVEQTVTETYGHEGSKSVQRQVQERSLFLPTMFLDLPFPVQGGTFKSISDIPCFRTTFITERPFDQLLAITIRPTKEEQKKASSPRTDPEEQILKPWEKAEIKAFCGKPRANKPPKKPPKADHEALPTKDATADRRAKQREASSDSTNPEPLP